jgi:hypothetical protein
MATLKTIRAWVFGGLTLFGLIILLLKFGSCTGESPPKKTTMQAVPDDRYASVERGTYRPRSIPLLEPRPKRALPPGVDPLKVSRIVEIRLRKNADPLSVVELKTGEVLLERDSTVESVEVTDFTPPIFLTGLGFAVGLSLGMRDDGRWTIRPAGSVSALEILGTVRAPVFALDTDALGLIAETKIYHGIWAGLGVFWPYAELERRSIRITIQYTL